MTKEGHLAASASRLLRSRQQFMSHPCNPREISVLIVALEGICRHDWKDCCDRDGFTARDGERRAGDRTHRDVLQHLGRRRQRGQADRRDRRGDQGGRRRHHLGLRDPPGRRPCTANSLPPRGKSVAAKIAEALGFHYYDQTAQNPAIWANAIISRYPIVKPTPDDLGVPIDVDGRTVYVFSRQSRRRALPAVPVARHRIWRRALLQDRGEGDQVGRGDARKIVRRADRRRQRGERRGGDLHRRRLQRAVASRLDRRDRQGRAAAARRSPGRAPPSWKRRASSTPSAPSFPDAAAKPGITWTPTTRSLRPGGPSRPHRLRLRHGRRPEGAERRRWSAKRRRRRTSWSRRGRRITARS